ncbi:MAG: hypothetical protein L6R42_007654 [Xanthoria sp. 1 TBL-2021]|nr:MAG: hypothetical protein L6R42_007654 [Xanthoria sp. 1 TBL-2021]
MSSPPSSNRRASSPGSSHRHTPRPSHSRSRSRSPPPRRRNDDHRPKISTGGFRWKDKSKDTDRYDRPDERRLERGYRERDRDDRYRDRDGDRDDRNGYRDGDSRRRERDAHGHRDRDRNRDRHGDRYDDKDRHDDRSSRRNEDEAPRDRRRARSTTPPVADTASTNTKAPKEPKSKKTKVPKIAPTAEPMIIVNVNDRLGTKTAIPCLASDSIGDFKKLVGAHVGRKPHEIMLKRQGERPFKDVLTLEDYGVSHGVQLDLEVDTGD